MDQHHGERCTSRARKWLTNHFFCVDRRPGEEMRLASQQLVAWTGALARRCASRASNWPTGMGAFAGFDARHSTLAQSSTPQA
eukprot:362032-Chlamydomonas_euryale.AAC.2